MLQRYIEEIIKNGDTSTLINDIEFYCEYHNKETGEFIFKRIEGEGYCEVYNDTITLEHFKRWYPNENPNSTLADKYKSKCIVFK